jgi:SNF2 family DNA or RNA helicase
MTFPMNSCEHFEAAERIETVEPRELREAIALVEAKQVEVFALHADGCIQGSVQSGPNRRHCIVRLTPEGQILLPQPEEHESIVPSLALVLSLLWQIRFARKQGEFKSLLRSGPAWLNADYRLNVSIPGWSSNTLEKQWPEKMDGLEDLQAYWELLSLARASRHPIPPETLVHQVLGLYGQAPWAMKRAAMETVLKRLDSSVKEDLTLSSHPEGKGVLGPYSIRRKKGAQRPYEVLLTSNQGINASCSCKDFQKNELGFCKHIATVLLYWHRSEAQTKRFNKAAPLLRHRIQYTISLSLDKIVDPLSNISFVREPSDQSDIRRWKTWFDSETHQLMLTDEPAAREKKLKILLKLLTKETENSIAVDSVIIPLLKKALAELHWPVRYPQKLATFQKTMEGMHYKLYPYQREGVLSALARGKFLLGDDMGLGKTVQAITWAECLMQAREAKVVLVICPAGLKTQWQREWGQAAGRDCQVVTGSPSERQSIYQSTHSCAQATVLILNYELVCRDLEDLIQLSPSAIILDEAQRIKNYATQTALMVKALQPPFRLILTGTPLENRLLELSSLMDWIDDHAMGPQWRLDSETRISGDGEGHGPRGVKGLKMIRERLAPHFLRRLRSKVLGDLPSRTDSVLTVPIAETQTEIHTDLGIKVSRLMAIAANRPLTPSEHLRLMSLLTSMRIVSNGMAQYEYDHVWDSLKADLQPEWRIPKLESPKLQAFRDLIAGLLSQEGLKIVVFSQWQRMLRLAHWAIQDLLEDCEAEAVFFTGRENPRRRTENIVRFHDDPAVRLFFATDAGGVGLNLQKAATICINLELPWNPAVLEQRIGRLHRLGQKQPVQVFNLVTENSIEERIGTLVGQKRAVFNELFDGTGDEVIYDKASSFYEQVRSVVQELDIRPDYSDLTLESESSDTDILAEELDCPELCDDIVPPDEELGEIASKAILVTSIEAQSPESSDIVSNSSESSDIASPSPKPSPEKNLSDPIPEAPSPISAENLWNAFREVKVEKTQQGTLRIEASGESAKLLAGMFRGMAEMFESTS